MANEHTGCGEGKGEGEGSLHTVLSLDGSYSTIFRNENIHVGT